MNLPLKDIDPELWNAIKASPYNTIDYEKLLALHPAAIRDLEKAIDEQSKSSILPEDIELKDIHISSTTSPNPIKLRIYQPIKKQNLPILLFFHGGAFCYGTVEQYDDILTKLATSCSMLVVSVDYRLAPEHPFPAAMLDGYDALCWLSTYGKTLHGDPDTIMIAGSSAGATIAASITHLTRDKQEVNLKHQYLLYPPMSNRCNSNSMQLLAEAPMQSKNAAIWMWKNYLQNTTTHLPKYAVPLSEENFKNLPDATIIVCALDPLKDEGKEYAKQLQQSGNNVHLIEIPKAVHTFDFFHCDLTEQFHLQKIELFHKIINKLCLKKF